MSIINFSFLLITIKIFLLIILNLNNYIIYKLKNYCIYYFIYDIIICTLILIINLVYIKNFALRNFLLNLSVIALILQSYVFLYIAYLITKKSERIPSHYKKLFYYNILTLNMKILLSVLYNYNETFFNFSFFSFFYKYKIFFFVNILFHILFQYNVQIKSFLEIYFYIKN